MCRVIGFCGALGQLYVRHLVSLPEQPVHQKNLLRNDGRNETEHPRPNRAIIAIRIAESRLRGLAVNSDIAQQIWVFVGKLLVEGGGTAAIAYGLLRYFGKNWIEHRLAKELESTKSELSVLAARRMKLHDREHALFPELWSRLNKVLASLDRVVLSLRQIPPFGRFTDSDIEAWIGRSDLSDDERRYFTSEKNKEYAYNRILDARDLNEAQKDYIEFHNHLQDSRIFLSPEIKGKLDEIDKSAGRALTARKMDWSGLGRGSGKDFLLEAADTLDEKVKPLMSEIELLVQGRLFPEVK